MLKNNWKEVSPHTHEIALGLRCFRYRALVSDTMVPLFLFGSVCSSFKRGRPTGANYYNWLYFTQVVRKAAVVVGMQGSPGNHH